MKLVKCIVREDKVDETTDALKQIDVSGFTVSHVGGRGRHPNPTACWRGLEYEIRYLPRMMLDVVVADYMVDDVVRVVMETARTRRRRHRRHR